MARFARAWFAHEEESLWFPGALAGGGGAGNKIHGTSGDDRRHGTDGNDIFLVSQGGDDKLIGNAGDDKFKFGSTYSDADIVFGGAGRDTIFLDGGTSDNNLVLGPSNVRQVEAISVGQSGTYNFTLLDGVPDLDIRVTDNCTLNVDGSNVVNSRLREFGGVNVDHLIGGAGRDLLVGRTGDDILEGGPGKDRFLYQFEGESWARLSYKGDTIVDFAKGDRITLHIRVHANLLYHIGETPERTGDVVVSYDETANRTHVEVFLDDDDKPDMQFNLLGDCTTLQVSHGNELMLG